ncbi:gamma-Secretase-activating protein C-term [Popillia japonica]|uniref:Gamma-Secretase-activating protein C-term n=1 Tax=Popillia japonica TaxID=7064 RepID=A0AAW1LSU5_POPJA
MVLMVDNIGAKLCQIVTNENVPGETKEWRLLGQEEDGSLLFTWIEENTNRILRSCIGLYNYPKNKLERIFTFNKPLNVVQASINAGRTILAYVLKHKNDKDVFTYRPYLVRLEDYSVCDLNIERSKQIMLQFLLSKHSILNENQTERLLLLIHEECILQYQIRKTSDFHLESFIVESIVRIFIWAQWDAKHQTLYYIHFRKPVKSILDVEDAESNGVKMSPMLSGLQFHDDLPHESVLNIPLNLPHLSPVPSPSCGVYEDDTVPLRVHNCSLDLIVLTNSEGAVCICHHYLYEPGEPEKSMEEHNENTVHFAYTVTILHHSCVIHCIIPGIPWKKAKLIRPVFKLYDDYMLVYIPEICTHLLDIGFSHDPSCHIITTAREIPGLDLERTCLTLVDTLGNYSVLNMPTLDIIDLRVSTEQLAETFKKTTSLENKLSIIHYLLVHKNETENVIELLSHEIEQPFSTGLPQLFREFLIGSSYASVQRNLPSDASQLINLLPVTMQSIGSNFEAMIGNKTITLSQDTLWNASMMLLSPQQRVTPYRPDIWVKLWERLMKNSKGKQKFKPSQVVEKLLVSLVCYQPEALSRSSTPMSPATSLTFSTSNLPKDLSTLKNSIDSLPFYEMESCTASKQEHIISVNLRELSMHLLKQSTDNRVTCFQWQTQTPMHVHAVATRYIGAQLEQSRYLCQALCKICTRSIKWEEKGFVFIDLLPDDLRFVLFTTLEQYYLAAESIAFPVPLGFTSFFTFLGYRTLKFNTFLQYVQRNVFELQIDVMKIIMADILDTKKGVERKLTLLSLLPRMRAKRLLNQWSHPVSLMIRAREHSMNVLSGVEAANAKPQILQKTKNYQLGLAAFPTGDRLSPLDTFLDLLTAKASLNELDFGLLIEATITSTDDFL